MSDTIQDLFRFLSPPPFALLMVLRASEPAYCSHAPAPPDHLLLPQVSNRGQSEEYLEHEFNRMLIVQKMSSATFLASRVIEAGSP